jgi:hypothetical protein
MSLDIESFAALAASIIFTLVISPKPPRWRPQQLSLDIRDAEKRDKNQAEYQCKLDKQVHTHVPFIHDATGSPWSGVIGRVNRDRASSL